MNFLSSYARKIATGKIVISDELKYTVMIFSIAGVHTALIFLFYYMQVYPMFFFNIASVTLYISCSFLVRRNLYLKVFLLTFAEIVLHSFVATLFVGWQFGFPLYIIALVPCSYYVLYTVKTGRRKIFIATILALFSFASFIGCRIFSLFVMPVYQSFDPTLEAVIYNFNTICTYVFLIFFSVSFILEMQNFTRKLEQQNMRLEELANVDPLTGLFNRRYAYAYMENMVKRNEAFYIMMCDIDDFKKLNDSYGHDFGDIVLKGVSLIVQEEIAEQGNAFRWGGEEILIFCDNPDAEKAHTLAENIRKRLSEHAFDFNAQPVHSSLTIGVFRYSPGDNIEKTISTADENLYIGKGRGKNIVIM